MGLKEAGRGGEAIEGAYGHIENFSAIVGICRILSEFMRRRGGGRYGNNYNKGSILCIRCRPNRAK